MNKVHPAVIVRCQDGKTVGTHISEVQRAGVQKVNSEMILVAEHMRMPEYRYITTLGLGNCSQYRMIGLDLISVPVGKEDLMSSGYIRDHDITEKAAGTVVAVPFYHIEIRRFGECIAVIYGISDIIRGHLKVARDKDLLDFAFSGSHPESLDEAVIIPVYIRTDKEPVHQTPFLSRAAGCDYQQFQCNTLIDVAVLELGIVMRPVDIELY